MARKKRNREAKPEQSQAQSLLEETGPHKVRMPGFLIEEEIGLGDLIKKTSYAMGIKPCGGCEKRAATLNRWISFTR